MSSSRREPRCVTEMSAAEYRRHVEDHLTEGAFQAQIERVARELGWLVYHGPPNVVRCPRCRREVFRWTEPGFPDLVLVHPARRLAVFWEVKQQHGAVREEQETWLAALSRAQVIEARVVRPRDWSALVNLLRAARSAEEEVRA